MENRRVLLLGDMNSRWTFKYIKNAFISNVNLTIIDFASSKLPIGNDYYEFCKKNGIRVFSIYNDDGYSRCLKFVSIINQMDDFDVCHVMFVSYGASIVVRLCEHKFHYIISNFWGSDLYRTTKKIETEQKFLLDITDTVIVSSENMKENFLMKYPYYKGLIYIVNFESPILEKLQQNINIAEDEITLQLPKEKTVIAVGYNGTCQQQHELVISALNQCDSSILKNVFIVFFMTYGLQDEYENRILSMLQKSEFEYLLIKDYMSDNQIVLLRRRIDVFVNAMTTDAFNAALQESMLCGSVILIGDWLYYKEIEENGGYIKKFCDRDDLSQKISDVIENLSDYKVKSGKNRDILISYRNNRSHVEDWIDLYEFNHQKHISDNSLEILDYVLKKEMRQSERKNLYYEVMQVWLEKRVKNIEPIKQYINQKGYKSIVIYGAGTLGEMVYDEINDLDISINVCDKNETKVHWTDKEIISVPELEKVIFDCIIITPVHLHNEIANELINIGVKEILSLKELLK